MINSNGDQKLSIPRRDDRDQDDRDKPRPRGSVSVHPNGVSRILQELLDRSNMFSKKSLLKKLVKVGTHSDHNVECGVLCVFVNTSRGVCADIREILCVSRCGGHFMVFVDGIFFLGLVQSGC